MYRSSYFLIIYCPCQGGRRAKDGEDVVSLFAAKDLARHVLFLLKLSWSLTKRSLHYRLPLEQGLEEEGVYCRGCWTL